MRHAGGEGLQALARKLLQLGLDFHAVENFAFQGGQFVFKNFRRPVLTCPLDTEIAADPQSGWESGRTRNLGTVRVRTKETGLAVGLDLSPDGAPECTLEVLFRLTGQAGILTRGTPARCGVPRPCGPMKPVAWQSSTMIKAS